MSLLKQLITENKKAGVSNLKPFVTALKRYGYDDIQVEDALMLLEEFVGRLFSKEFIGLWKEEYDFNKIIDKELYKDLQINFGYDKKIYRVIGVSSDYVNLFENEDLDSEESINKATRYIYDYEPLKRPETFRRLSWSKSIGGVEYFLSKIFRNSYEIVIEQEKPKNTIDVSWICKSYLDIIDEIKNPNEILHKMVNYKIFGKVRSQATLIYRVNEVLSVLDEDNFKIIDIRKVG